MGDVPKPKRYLFNFEELTILIVIGILFCLVLLPHWLDPSFNTFRWFSAKINNKPLPSFHPHWLVFKAQTVQILLKILRLSLIVIFFVSIYLGWRFYWRQQQRKSMKSYRILLSRDDLTTPQKVVAFFDTAAKILSTRYLRYILGNNPMNLALYRQPNGELVLLLRTAEKYVKKITASLQAAWTSVRIEPYNLQIVFPGNPVVAVVRPRKRTDLFAFRSYRDYTESVTEDLLSQMDNMNEPVIIDFAIKPLPNSYSDKVVDIQRKHQRDLNALQVVDYADPTLSMGDQAQLQGVVKQAGRSWWRVDIRIVAPSNDGVKSLWGALSSSDAENQWLYHMIIVRKKWILNLIQSGMPGFMPLSLRFFLNGAFLSTIWQVPSARLRAQGLTRSPIRRAPGIVGLTRNSSGCTPVKDEYGSIDLLEEDRKNNVLVIGQQGTGKTTVLKQVAKYDFTQDKAVILIDPKGQFADEMRDFVPEGRKVATWKLARPDNEWGWNPFLQEVDKNVQISGILDAMIQRWGKEAIGPRSSDYLRHAMRFTLDTNQAAEGFSSVISFLQNPALWGRYADMVNGPLADWLRSKANDYEENARAIVEHLSAPLNKLNEFNDYDIVRQNLAPSRSLDLGRLVRDRGILIVNLEPGVYLHEMESNLIGTFLLTGVWDTIRRNGSLADLLKTSVIVDEIHRMICDAISVAMAEGRSYGFQSSIGLQFLKQIENEKLRESIVELIQNLFIFRSNQIEETEDYAKLLARIYSNLISPDSEMQDKLSIGPDDRFNLPDYRVICRILSGGVPRPAFIGETIPLPSSTEEERDAKLPWGTCPPEWLIDAKEHVVKPVTTREIINVAMTSIAQEYEPEPEQESNDNDNRINDLLPDAVQILKQEKLASISIFQRRLKIGYTVAAKLMERLEDNGLVGPNQGAVPRQIFFENFPPDTEEDPEELFSESLNEQQEVVTIQEQENTEPINQNPLAFLSITDEQYTELINKYDQEIVDAAVGKVKWKAKRETLLDPFAYFQSRCENPKRKTSKRGNEEDGLQHESLE